ncbi:hypothetical protein ILUMI_18295, partial [Ignelater luminosus]
HFLTYFRLVRAFCCDKTYYNCKVISRMTDTEEKKNSKVFIGLYITFCVLFITWLTSKFFKGRRQIHQAFDTIGLQLQRMQEQLDQRTEAEEGMIENHKDGEDGKIISSTIHETEKDDEVCEKDKLKDE